MAQLIAQISDVHIGGHTPGNGERFSMAVDEINAMGAQPDLVLLTGDLTQDATPQQWAEVLQRIGPLRAPWVAIAGNHDRGIAELAGHRAMDSGPLRLVLLDTSAEDFTAADAAWLDDELAAHCERPTVIAVHHPPFDTGIWWMDCIGLRGRDRFEPVVRRHPQVLAVLSGHIHRPIHAQWGTCSLWVCPSTAVAIAPDLDPAHDPAETAEPPMIGLHAFTASGLVSHLVPVGATARRASLAEQAPAFVRSLRTMQAEGTIRAE